MTESLSAQTNRHFGERLKPSDATVWRIERDPALRTTIVGITLLGRTPAWSDLRRRLAELSVDIPRLRQRVADGPFGYGPPRWVEDKNFDLDTHLRRVRAPRPGDLQTVLDIAAPIAMAPFDRDRPLWEFTLVDGLADGHAAIVQKIHHSMTDGVGAVRLSRLLFDPEPSGATGAAQKKRQAVLEASRQHEHHDTDLAELGIRLVQDSFDAARHPMRTTTNVIRTTESVARLLRPVREPMSPIMRERGMSRRLMALDFSLDALKAAGHAAGGTMNDAFLAALAGGMHRYHKAHGVQCEALRVTMPVNLRRDDDPLGGNRFTPVRFTLPIDIADPRKRMRGLGDLARSERREPALGLNDVIAAAFNVVPPQVTAAVMGSMLKSIDLVATNVPGLTEPVRLTGAPVLLQYAFAPTSGAAFSAALFSYLDHCTIGLVFDTSAVHDPQVLAACIAEGCAEVLATGRPRPRTSSAQSRKRASGTSASSGPRRAARPRRG